MQAPSDTRVKRAMAKDEQQLACVAFWMRMEKGKTSHFLGVCMSACSVFCRVFCESVTLLGAHDSAASPVKLARPRELAYSVITDDTNT